VSQPKSMKHGLIFLKWHA